MSNLSKGLVYLVGAGPGDPELLTMKAFRLIKQADVIFFDALVSKEIMALVPDEIEKIYVGKRRSNHQMPQQDINQILVEHAKNGRCVVRLKGGDPFIFGRGGEEVEELLTKQIPFEVVPGITAASGCASYAGIPLTHRDHAQSVKFVTAHLKDGSPDLPWADLVRENQTLVFYMGLSGLGQICNNLIKHGAAPELPAAIVSKGTTPEQRVIRATLASLPELQNEQKLTAPTLIIVGTVAGLNLVSPY